MKHYLNFVFRPLMAVALLLVMVSCEKEEDKTPKLTTVSIGNNITATTAVSGGNIISDAGTAITQKGVVWGTAQNPTIENNIGITNDGSGSDDFTSNITGLTPSTKYYIRAYARNSNGVGYGDELDFTTLEEPWDAKHITNILIEDYTATWCGYCPRVHYAIKSVTEENSSIHAMAIYDDSDKRYANISQMIAAFNITGYPTAMINRKDSWSYPENMSGLTDYLSTPSPLGIAIESSVSNSTANISVNVEYAKNFTSGLKIVVCLTESKLIGSQANYYNDGNGNPIINFEHNHVLRKASTDIFGDAIPSTETVKDNVSTHTYTMSLDGYVIENCNIVAFVTDNSFKVLNVQEVKLGESKDFQYITK